jgi:RNA polymerase sigma-70 factor (ECF subfamily)
MDELLRRCGSGDEAAWEEFVRTYRRTLEEIARSALRSMRRPEADADEIVARVFSMLVENDYAALRRFRGQCSFTTWLRILVRTACVRAVRRRALPTREIARPEPPLPLDRLESDELRDAVRRALDRLPERDRLALTLFFFDGRSYDEIASELGVPMGTVATILSRTREKLRRMITGGGP